MQVPTFSEWVKRNMPGYTLVSSKVPGEKEIVYGRQDDGVEGNGGREDDAPSPTSGAPQEPA